MQAIVGLQKQYNPRLSNTVRFIGMAGGFMTRHGSVYPPSTPLHLLVVARLECDVITETEMANYFTIFLSIYHSPRRE